ncbi:MAG: hypothetical protein R3E53_10130 [Myxococcota bacterium]
MADVRLNRPDKMNAVNHEMWQALGGIGEVLAAESGVRAPGRALGQRTRILLGPRHGELPGHVGRWPRRARRPGRDAGRDRPENFFQRAALSSEAHPRAP